MRAAHPATTSRISATIIELASIGQGSRASNECLCNKLHKICGACVVALAIGNALSETSPGAALRRSMMLPVDRRPGSGITEKAAGVALCGFSWPLTGYHLALSQQYRIALGLGYTLSRDAFFLFSRPSHAAQCPSASPRDHRAAIGWPRDRSASSRLA